MDYTGWAEMQHNPNPYPNSNSGVSSLLQTVNYSGSFSHNLNSDPHQQPSIDPHNPLFLSQPQPPGVEPPPSYVPPAITVEYGQQPISLEPQQVDAAAAALAAYNYYYYSDPNADWAAAIQQIGATNYAPGATTPNTAIKSQKRNMWVKGPKKIKIVQSAWCEVCKVDCNSKDVLDQHKLGKKHQKNLEKLNEITATIPAPAVVAAHSPAVVAAHSPAIAPLPVSTVAAQKDTPTIIGPKENPEKPKSSNAKKAKKKAVERTENLETKRRKVLEGGAAAETVRTCTVCNVVCNSNTVFNYHLAGQRHASMVRKLASGAGVASAMLNWTG